MSKGSSAPPAPDYAPIAQGDQATAAAETGIAANNLKWAQQQYAEQAPYTDAYMTSMTNASNAQMTNAAEAQGFYKSTYQPIETQFAQQARDYNTPARANQNAGMAEADVASQFGAQRQAALSSLESYGIDPSQTRFGALDLGTRVSQAAATAAAGTTSRLNTEATGLNLENQAINIGRGYPGQVTQSYQGATNSGQAGVNAGINTTSMGSNIMGTPTSWMNGATNANNSAASALNMGYNNAASGAGLRNQAAGNTTAGIGSLIGAGVGIAAIAV